jgi:hypothetical protein
MKIKMLLKSRLDMNLKAGVCFSNVLVWYGRLGVTSSLLVRRDGMAQCYLASATRDAHEGIRDVMASQKPS